MEPATIMGEDIDFKGSLRFKNGLKILGKFKGTIETNGDLIIGDTAELKADIHTGTIEIGGIIRGNIIADKKVAIKSKGNIRGDIKTPDFQIESGAKFTGSCQME